MRSFGKRMADGAAPRTSSGARVARQPVTRRRAPGLRRAMRRASCSASLSARRVTVQVLTTHTSAVPKSETAREVPSASSLSRRPCVSYWLTRHPNVLK
ncbi:MAG: hypothetical protein ABII00_08345 [Elusimicrobiota bacterium]